MLCMISFQQAVSAHWNLVSPELRVQFRGLGTEVFPHRVRALKGKVRWINKLDKDV